jgi:FMN phosphatase YigB (HAD superfamily)/DNA-binding XRE family transcriptional regulator
MDEKTLGKRLQLARKRAGLTQQELCQKAGLSYSTLAKIERGAIRSPSVFTVSAIAAATGTPLEDLLGSPTQNAGSPAPVNTKKRSKTGVSFVYLDINGTMVQFFHKAFTEIARACGKSADFVETVYWRYNDSAISGQVSLEDLNATLARELGLEGFDWQKYYLANVEPMPGIDELVSWVAENYEVGVLSNNMPGFIHELTTAGKIPQVGFSAIVDSSKVGVIKPDAKIYEIAQQMAAVEPREILLIDNERPNLIAADHAGWQVLWFDDMDPAGSLARAKSALEF